MTAARPSDENSPARPLAGRGSAPVPALERELARILASADTRSLGLPRTLREARGYDGPPIEALCRMREHVLGRPLAALARADARFGERGAVLLNMADGGGRGFYPNFFGASMVRRLLETQSVDSAIAWLSKVLATPAATGYFISAVHGVDMAEPVALGADTRLVPLDAVPASDQKMQLESARIGGDLSFADWSPPRAALMTRLRIEPFTRMLSEVEGPDSQPPTRAVSLEHEAIALALTAAGPVTPVIVGHWFTFDDPDLQLATQADNHSGGRMLEIAPRPTIEVPRLEAAAVTRFVTAYLAMDGQRRKVIDVALLRLRQARARHGPGNAAIELCTAFEALHLNRPPPEKKAHPRCSGWVAWKIGQDASDSDRIDQTIARLHDIRNTLIHSLRAGEVAQTYDLAGRSLTAAEVVQASMALCMLLLQHVVEPAAPGPGAASAAPAPHRPPR